MKKICKYCKWWKNPDDELFVELGLKKCSHPNFVSLGYGQIFDLAKECNLRNGFIVYDGSFLNIESIMGDSAQNLSGEEFGCVHFERKELKNEKNKKPS